MAESASPEEKPTPRAKPLRRWGVGLNVAVQLATAFALFLLVNYASYRHFLRRDLSPSQDYSISDQTENILRKISKDVTITTGLVDTYTIPQLLKLVASGRLDPTVFATHRFALGDTMDAYDVFADAASSGALKVVLEGAERRHGANGHVAAGALTPTG